MEYVTAVILLDDRNVGKSVSETVGILDGQRVGFWLVLKKEFE